MCVNVCVSMQMYDMSIGLHCLFVESLTVMISVRLTGWPASEYPYVAKTLTLRFF